MSLFLVVLAELEQWLSDDLEQAPREYWALVKKEILMVFPPEQSERLRLVWENG